jgi:protein-S-isoprenylcysteine O-methyltransferase Ste14
MTFTILQNFQTNPLGTSISLIISFCIFIIFLAVFINFIEDKHQNKNIVKEKKSIVETGTMAGFFFLVYLLLKLEIGQIEINSNLLHAILVLTGTVIMILGTIVNVLGRFKLGKNWANQVKIYQKHNLVQVGVYSWVRHPLYASLIWMFYAGSLIFVSWSTFLATTLIFVPFMYYRAKQEEKLLSEKFPDYQEYRQKVGMFFPKFW